MSQANREPSGWKKKAVEELTAYWTNFTYLACFFGVFTWYRRLILEEYDIRYVKYGFALVQALVLAKVILLGDALRLGKRTEQKPLIYATLYKSVIFAIWVAVFKVIEHTISGMFRGKGLAGGIEELRQAGADAILAESLVVLCAFVPFFAFRELGRIMGEGRIKELFFRRSAQTAPIALNGTHTKSGKN